jgi:hypothetical protein
MLSRYKDHDVSEDPVLFLRCGHFFTLSTLDGVLKMKEVYDLNAASSEFVSARPLREAFVTEKPLTCPDCRVPIEGIRRYGRMLNLSMIRGLERKHMMKVDGRLDELSKIPATSLSAEKVDAVLEMIRRSPMQVVFEACRGSPLVEVPQPPSRPHLRALELMSTLYTTKAEKFNDANYAAAVKTLAKAIEVATDTRSLRSAALLKITYAKFRMRHANEVEHAKVVKIDVAPHLDWVKDQLQFQDLVQEAQELSVQLQYLEESVKRNARLVFRAMSSIGGYNYGGSASSHWYECPNGHAYFIGECGGAMQESRCSECGAPVGGTGHRLLASNRRATNFLSRLFGTQRP